MKPKDLQQVLEADLQHVWHPITQHRILAKQPPKVIVGAHGSTVVDAEGREYLDGMAGLWCVNVGYGRREIAEAVYRQLLELPYYPHTQANVPAATLADRLTVELQGMTAVQIDDKLTDLPAEAAAVTFRSAEPITVLALDHDKPSSEYRTRIFSAAVLPRAFRPPPPAGLPSLRQRPRSASWAAARPRCSR